jgi:hypothetical protein
MVFHGAPASACVAVCSDRCHSKDSFIRSCMDADFFHVWQISFQANKPLDHLHIPLPTQIPWYTIIFQLESLHLYTLKAFSVATTQHIPSFAMALKRTIDTSGVRTGPLHDDLEVEECGQRHFPGSVWNHDGGEAERKGGSGGSEGGQCGEEDGKEDGKDGEEDGKDGEEDGNDGEEDSENSNTSAVGGPERFSSFVCYLRDY